MVLYIITDQHKCGYDMHVEVGPDHQFLLLEHREHELSLKNLSCTPTKKRYLKDYKFPPSPLYICV